MTGFGSEQARMTVRVTARLRFARRAVGGSPTSFDVTRLAASVTNCPPPCRSRNRACAPFAIPRSIDQTVLRRSGKLDRYCRQHSFVLKPILLVVRRLTDHERLFSLRPKNNRPSFVVFLRFCNLTTDGGPLRMMAFY